MPNTHTLETGSSAMTAEQPTTAELATAHFEALERVRLLGMMNTSQLDYDGRKAAAVEYALAMEVEFKARQELAKRIGTANA